MDNGNLSPNQNKRYLANTNIHSFFLAGDKDIVTTDLKLKYSDNKEYPLKEYTEKCDLLCQNEFADLTILQEKWEKIINWNFYTIDYHLNELKKKLMRYKSYVMCGHAPENYKNYVSKGE